MNVRIYSCPDSDFKPYVERAVQFYGKILIPNTRIRNNCTIVVRFDSKINEYGFCSIEDYNTANKPRSFNVEIHPGLGVRGILATLAHEMVHVKQYIYEETNDDLSHWRGKKIDSDLVEYWSHPWEIDAYGRETGLLTKFAIAEQLWDVFEEFRNPALPIISMPIRWKNI
jgi:hypothetical protein